MSLLLLAVSFLKRAQIFAADVWARFGGEGYGEFHDIDSLTMFADYRLARLIKAYTVSLTFNLHLAINLYYRMNFKASVAVQFYLSSSSLYEAIATSSL